MFLFSLILPSLLHHTYSISFILISELLFYILTFVVGSFVGIIFPLVVEGHYTKGGSPIGKFYGLDLLGSVFGFIAASLILIPMLGLINTSNLLAIFVFFLIFLLVLIE